MNASISANGAHPYYPLGLNMPAYVPNTMGASLLVSIFALGCAGIFAMTYLLAVRLRPGIGTREVLIAFWWSLCGFIHLFFEGYFSYNHINMVSRTDLFGQLWKEYSLSDSRYMTQDPFVVCMETVTALFWGPLSFFIAYATITDHSWRHPLQLLVSMGQLYGDVLYYCICWYHEFVIGSGYSRPERYYYWAYFVLCNAFWVVIPLYHMAHSATTMAKVYEMARLDGSKKKRQ